MEDTWAVSMGDVSVFICYARADNNSSDSRLRWLDRLLEFVRPLARFGDLAVWSDKEILPGELWDKEISGQLSRAKVAVLLVSPAFLASDYIARSELPVLLKQAKSRGLKILPVIISPCLYEEARFNYPDWKKGPDAVPLGSLQSINPPSKTLVEVTEGEQNRVLLAVARQINSWLEEDRLQAEINKKPRRKKRAKQAGSNKKPSRKKRPKQTGRRARDK